HICQRLRPKTSQSDVEERRNNSYQQSMQNKARFNPLSHPQRTEETHHKRAWRSRVSQEGVAETKAERHDCQNKSDFGEHSGYDNSSPTQIRANHFRVRKAAFFMAEKNTATP